MENHTVFQGRAFQDNSHHASFSKTVGKRNYNNGKYQKDMYHKASQK
jgi:hypothetical protein